MLAAGGGAVVLCVLTMTDPRLAVFLDRDGTLNEMVYSETHGVMDSPFTPDHFILKSGATRLVRELNRLGLSVYLVTNQPGFAKGTLTIERLDAIHRKLGLALAADDAALDGIYYCPHHPDPGARARPEFTTTCTCRKPEPGMLLQAAQEHDIDMSRSFMVGDGLNDVEAGRRAGVTTIFLSRLKPEVLEAIQDRPELEPHHTARNLDEVLEIIRAEAGAELAQQI